MVYHSSLPPKAMTDVELQLSSGLIKKVSYRSSGFLLWLKLQTHIRWVDIRHWVHQSFLGLAWPTERVSLMHPRPSLLPLPYRSANSTMYLNFDVIISQICALQSFYRCRNRQNQTRPRTSTLKIVATTFQEAVLPSWTQFTIFNFDPTSRFWNLALRQMYCGGRFPDFASCKLRFCDQVLGILIQGLLLFSV